MSSELNLPSAAMRESTMRSLRTAARRCHQMGLSWGQERDGARSPPQTYQITPRARERGRGGSRGHRGQHHGSCQRVANIIVIKEVNG